VSAAPASSAAWWRWLGLAGAVVVADQLTKALVRRQLADGDVVVTSFFNLVLAHNPGAAFSFLAGESGWQRWVFAALAVAASAWIAVLLRKYPSQKLFCLALALILGGAVGNLIDRVATGLVTDFLDFHIGGHHWPAFNVADSGICMGAFLLVWDALKPAARPRG